MTKLPGWMIEAQKIYDDVYAALLKHGFNCDVANFLADLSTRVHMLEQAAKEKDGGNG